MLTLHFHPLASFCWKVLIALYENGTPFEPHVVNLGDETDRNALLKLWPIGKMPVLEDGARDRIVPESTIVLEYLAQHYPGSTVLIPADPDRARQTRLADRFFDDYVHQPMQKIVTDRLRPPGKEDLFGVEEAKIQIRTAYDMIDADMAANRWAIGEEFTMADCAAAPALFYSNTVLPFSGSQENLAAYLDRLVARPSIARVLTEAEPYFVHFPMETKPRIPKSRV